MTLHVLSRALNLSGVFFSVPAVCLGSNEQRSRIAIRGIQGAILGAEIAKNIVVLASPFIAAYSLKKNDYCVLSSASDVVLGVVGTIFQTAYIGMVGGLIQGSWQYYWSR